MSVFESPPCRILICEDDPDMADIISQMLKPLGCKIDIANNAIKAKALLAQNVYRVMTLDIVMPGQDGLSFLKELREHETTRDLPVLVVSVCGMGDDKRISVSDFSISDWITKPLDPERFVASVKQALGKQALVKKSVRKLAKILHVEDHSSSRELVSTFLRKAGSIVAAKGIQEAKSLLLKEDFDLIIMNATLPDGEGSELLPFVGSAPVIFLSTHPPLNALPESALKVLGPLDQAGNELMKAVQAAMIPK